MSVVSKILVVDDNEEFCQNMTDILELQGYKVTTASDGLKALELVKQDGFILVLLDIKLPVMGGGGNAGDNERSGHPAYGVE